MSFGGSHTDKFQTPLPGVLHEQHTSPSSISFPTCTCTPPHLACFSPFCASQKAPVLGTLLPCSSAPPTAPLSALSCSPLSGPTQFWDSQGYRGRVVGKGQSQQSQGPSNHRPHREKGCTGITRVWEQPWGSRWCCLPRCPASPQTSGTKAHRGAHDTVEITGTLESGLGANPDLATQWLFSLGLVT